MYLDGTITSGRHIQQSDVTNISLLLVTAFKGCVVAAVGLAFTQHMWMVLRRQTLPIGRIEQLFSIRSNPTQLTKLRLVADTPILFLIGLFVWLVPIATIYPPSALTVTSRAYTLRDYANVPILFPPLPSIDSNSAAEMPGTRLSRVSWNFNQHERRVYSSWK